LPLLLLLSACVTVQDGPTQNEKASDINVQLGIGYYRQGNLEQANAKLLKALKQNPKNSQAHFAYAVLLTRFTEYDKAEEHFRKAVELDPKNSEALNNFGAFLCNKGRTDEAEKMFLRAVKNPLYKTPEVAYSNAAACLVQHGKGREKTAKKYLIKALSYRGTYPPALIQLAELTFEQGQYDLTRLYLKRLHLATKPSARSLWLAIRTEIALDNPEKARELGQLLEESFPDAEQTRAWKKLEQDG
jgi:type IV pilus assembly protein PilF